MSRVAHPAGPRHADVLPPDHPPQRPADVNALDPAIWPRTARRDGGALVLGGLDARELAAEFGTPVFVCDEEDFRGRCRDFREAFGADAGVFYAAKAFCCRTVLRWVSQEGLGVDVCTGGELEVALQAGVAPEMITLHGSNKLPGELERAVAAGVGHIVVDSFDEIARLTRIAERPEASRSAAPRPRVLVRVTTGVEAAVHEFVATAHDDQKFGFSLASGAADEAVRQVLDERGARLRRPALAHRLADLRHGRLRGGRAPGARARRPDQGLPRRRHRRAEPGRRLRHRLHAGRRPGRHQGGGAEPAGHPGARSAGPRAWTGPG